MRLVFIQPNSAFVSEAIPLGFAWLASTLKQKKAAIKIIDGTAPYAKYSDENMIRLCKEFSADAVGVVFMTSHVYKAYDLLKKLKVLNVPIIGGGYHATKFPQEVLDHGVDIVMRGEAERTISELVDYFDGKKSLKDIKGISYKEDGRTITNPSQPLIENLDELPLPDREAFNLQDFARSENEIKNVMSTILTSRGCPFSCAFCASQNTGYRFRSAENVVKEIRQIKAKYGVRNFYFVDDTINVNRERLIALCDALKEENIVWRCNGRYDLVDKELLIKMKESGCIYVSFGVESGDEEVLKRLHKNLTPQLVKEKIKLVHDIGIGQTANFMFGFPFETPSNIENTIRFIQEVEPYINDLQRAGILMPFPGTTLYDEFKKDHNYDEWWLKPQDYMTEVRQSERRPLFKKFLFDDLGLLNEKGRFFNYSKPVVKKIRKGMQTIDHIVIRRKARLLNFTKHRAADNIIYLAILSFVYASKVLWKINPNIEQQIIHPIYYAMRRSKYYLKNRIY